MYEHDFHALVRMGRTDDVRAFVAEGIDVNARDDFGATPLHSAVAEKQVNMVEQLLSFGADPSIPDAKGRTSVHYAVEHRLPEVLSMLLSQHPEAAKVTDDVGNEPLWTASFNAHGNYEMVAMLVRIGGDPNHINSLGLSPFDVADRRQDEDLRSILEGQ